MQRDGRKRRVTTCMPCHTRKQKCNRKYPCNHCTKRRRPEECVYKLTPVDRPSSARTSIAESQNQSSDNVRLLNQQPKAQAKDLPLVALDGVNSADIQRVEIVQSFGYFEDSSSNTMALLRNWDFSSGGNTDTTKHDEQLEVFEKIQCELARIPPREVIDFLIQYFVSELNWMKQLVHVPSFLTHYQRWWADQNNLSPNSTEFAVLVLQISSYATQFLPSPSHPDGSIHGLPLSDIRRTSTELANRLSEACVILDWKGSLVRVQHILFAALNSSCEGRTDKFWEGIASASRAAQKAGVHTTAAVSISGATGEFERELQRRAFCNLYLLDSHLSRQLDRVPFLTDDLIFEMLPQLHLAPARKTETETNTSGSNISPPELFTERLMQVRLGIFWRKAKSRPESKAPQTDNQNHNPNTPYDPTAAEARYESFCTSYLPTLHPALSLTNPNKTWDSSLPHLPNQRALLAISILDSVAANFRPLLLLTPTQIAQLPMYKRVLLTSQKAKLAHAALEELDAIKTLHTLMSDGGPTRFAAIIFNSFEITVLLLTLLQQPDFPFELAGDDNSTDNTILGRRVRKLTYTRVLDAVEKALTRLHNLSPVSEMARSGAGIVQTLFDKARLKATPARNIQPDPDGGKQTTPSTATGQPLSELMGEVQVSIVPDGTSEVGGGLLPDSFTDFLGFGGEAEDMLGYPSSWGVADEVHSGSFHAFPSAENDFSIPG
ncbi:fungal specific transcription factor domain-containing protein [Aspergillus stella-maris]|uniref:fungal specific transcription factor domain-containing protein n=1 Tax=Aspergillus stella-maris TaxID=1810926 RepID=UPI003CCDBF4C